LPYTKDRDESISVGQDHFYLTFAEIVPQSFEAGYSTDSSYLEICLRICAKKQSEN